MDAAWGVVILAIGLLAWGGQALSSVSRDRAAALGVTEPAADLDPALDADVQGEAAWDLLTIWPLWVAGGLLLLDRPEWAYFGLAGGAVYLYFAGRGIAQRLAMRSRGVAIGSPATVRSALIGLVIFGVAGAVTIVLAVRDLGTG